jgi:hypothetical protein
MDMSDPSNPADAERRLREQQRRQRQLDQALADSFPASDPVSIVTSQDEDWEGDSPPPPAPQPPSSKPER